MNTTFQAFEKCEECQGNGYFLDPTDHDREVNCGECDGQGQRLTQFGREVAEVVRHLFATSQIGPSR